MRVLAIFATTALLLSGCWTSKTTTTETSHQQTVTPNPITVDTTRPLFLWASENCDSLIDAAVYQVANWAMDLETATGTMRVRLETKIDSLTRYADSLRHVRRWKQTLGVVAVPKDTSVKVPVKTITIEKKLNDFGLLIASAKFWASMLVFGLVIGFIAGMMLKR